MRKRVVLLGLVGAVGLLAVAAGTANAAPKKAPKVPGKKEEEPEAEIILPGPTGLPDMSKPPIVISEKTLPPPGAPIQVPAPATPEEVKENIKVVAEETGRTEAEVVAEAVAEVIPQNPSPVALEEMQPSNDPKGTIALAHLMLARENAPGWKKDLTREIALWQGKVGLENDGLFGEMSAAEMAKEVGILPLLRYHSKKHAAKKASLASYTRRISDVIKALENQDNTEAQILGLNGSMAREKGQAWGSTNPPANNTLEQVDAIMRAIAAKNIAEGEKEIS